MTAYEGFLLVIAIERLLELALSKRHERALLSAGQSVTLEPMFLVMVLVHAGVLVADRPFDPLVGSAAITLFMFATALRWWTIRTLGGQWTVRVVSGLSIQVRTNGPFRHVRHPNYLGVLLEVIAIPLVHSAYVSAIVFGAVNLWVVLRRIRLEEAALSAHSDYQHEMRGRARLIPRVY